MLINKIFEKNLKLKNFLGKKQLKKIFKNKNKHLGRNKGYNVKTFF